MRKAGVAGGMQCGMGRDGIYAVGRMGYICESRSRKRDRTRAAARSIIVELRGDLWNCIDDRAMVPGQTMESTMLVNVGKGIELDVNANALPANALEHVVKIGLRNILMDVHAGESDPKAAREKAERKLAALMSGEVRVTGTREGDPVRAEAMRIATDMVKAAIRKAGKKLADYEASAIREKAKEVLDSEKHGPEIMARAKANVAAKRELAEDLDIDV